MAASSPFYFDSGESPGHRGGESVRTIAREGEARHGELVRQARAVLEANWRSPGYCVPSATRYPWQWLWDSCFHAVSWAHLGEGERGVAEVRHALAHQEPDGFVPHITYWDRRDAHASLWGRAGTSTITQPPMYGHALAELDRQGVAIPDALVEQACRGLRHLLTVRMRGGAGPVIVHPWESGCDDSARWDAWCGGPWSAGAWRAVKGDLVEAVSGGVSSRFEVASTGFGALVAFNGRELAGMTGDASLRAEADALAERLAARWDGHRRTWVDKVIVGPPYTSAVRTLDALLPVLVVDDAPATAAAFADALDDRAFGGRYGPAAVHRDEPTFDGSTYWRGPAWPQLTYLLWVAARRQGDAATAEGLAARLIAGATQSGHAEYWDPDSGQGLGAPLQSWTALAAVVSEQTY